MRNSLAILLILLLIPVTVTFNGCGEEEPVNEYTVVRNVSQSIYPERFYQVGLDTTWLFEVVWSEWVIPEYDSMVCEGWVQYSPDISKLTRDCEFIHLDGELVRHTRNNGMVVDTLYAPKKAVRLKPDEYDVLMEMIDERLSPPEPRIFYAPDPGQLYFGDSLLWDEKVDTAKYPSWMGTTILDSIGSGDGMIH